MSAFTPHHRGPATREETGIIHAMLADSASDRQIAAALGRGVEWFKKQRRALGVIRDRPHLFSPADDRRIADLFKRRMSDVDIAAALARKPAAIMARRRKLNLHNPGTDIEHIGDGAGAARRHHQNRVASIMHLLDLKRAGHSPRDTELRIGPDVGVPWRARQPEPLRAITSSAALCAEMGEGG